MKSGIAQKRYLERHIEPGLPDAPGAAKQWQHVLVIPTYKESSDLLAALSSLRTAGKILVILVLNRPDTNPDTSCNSALRGAIQSLERTQSIASRQCPTYKLSDSVDLFCHDTESLDGPLPAAQGVGLARKAGCDIALLWQSQGVISSDWICSTDADAILPADYFDRLEGLDKTVAAVYPFAHMPGTSARVHQATALYELRLHQYVLGLRYANSPYAYHTLGSCIAVKRQHYCEVRGYPKRSGGEDFYLLNKLAKLGAIASLSGECIALQSRLSDRVPFGTGPAVERILADHDGDKNNDHKKNLFYHPQIFEVLRALLAVVAKLKEQELDELPGLLRTEGLSNEIATIATQALLTMGMAKAVSHCRKQGKSEEQFLRQFHQWFDGFKTLKFIHAVRDEVFPMQTLSGALSLQPELLPATASDTMDAQQICAAIRAQLQWSIGHK